VASYTVHDASTREFIRRFLAADEHLTSTANAQSALLAFNDSASVSSHHVLAAAHVLFRYLLLDTCADVFDVAQQRPGAVSSDLTQSLTGLDKLPKVHFHNLTYADYP
jgi:hypothetical protein